MWHTRTRPALAPVLAPSEFRILVAMADSAWPEKYEGGQSKDCTDGPITGLSTALLGCAGCSVGRLWGARTACGQRWTCRRWLHR